MASWVRSARFVILVITLTSVASVTSAQSRRLNRYSSAETASDAFQHSDAATNGHLSFSGQLSFDYAHDPLVVGDPEQAVVADQLDLSAALSLTLWSRVALSVGLPVSLVMATQDGASEESAGTSDAWLSARVLAFANRHVAIAGQASFTAPTATGEQLLRGENGFTFHPEILASIYAGPVTIGINVGARARRDGPSRYGPINDELTYSLALGFPLSSDRGVQLSGHVQLFGASSLGATSSPGTSLEALLGARLAAGAFRMGLGATVGLARGFGSPQFRAIVRFGIVLGDAERPPSNDDVPEDEEPPLDPDGDGVIEGDLCPRVPEDLDGVDDEDGCPETEEPDADEDGVPDRQDRCPDALEDQDGFEDADGCPDVDNDGDGVVDSADGCPDVAEDQDGFEDADGCREPDNDHDHVPDTEDRCPMLFGLEENGGCPERDTDGDRIVDAIDNCPEELGTSENFGCASPQLARLRRDRITLAGPLAWVGPNGSQVTRPARRVLRDVARIVASHPGRVLKVRVVVGQGPPRAEEALASRREQSLAVALVNEGLPPEQLETEVAVPDNLGERDVEFLFPVR